MYQILNLSPEEDNERTASQAFSCRSVVFERLRVPVRTCVCPDGRGEWRRGAESQPVCLCFSPQLVRFGWGGGSGGAGAAEVKGFERGTHYDLETADCLDNIVQTVAVMKIYQRLGPPMQGRSCF